MNNVQKEKSYSILLLQMNILTSRKLHRNTCICHISKLSYMDHLIMESSLDSVLVGLLLFNIYLITYTLLE